MRTLLFGLVAFATVAAFGETDHAGASHSGQGRATAPEVVRANRFNVTRPLGYYGNRLSDDFLKDLAALRADGHWIDGGSGDGVAIEQYHQLGLTEAAMDFASDATGPSPTSPTTITKPPSSAPSICAGVFATR
jgi:hypothetical protein